MKLLIFQQKLQNRKAKKINKLKKTLKKKLDTRSCMNVIELCLTLFHAFMVYV